MDLKRRPDHPWGGPAWQASYARRARAEGTHGILKASDSGAVRRGFTRYPLTTIDVGPRPFRELDPDAGIGGGTAPPLAA